MMKWKTTKSLKHTQSRSKARPITKSKEMATVTAMFIYIILTNVLPIRKSERVYKAKNTGSVSTIRFFFDR